MCITVNSDGMDVKNRKILAFHTLKLRKIGIIFILGSLSNINLCMVSKFVFDSLSSYLGCFCFVLFSKPTAKFDDF